MAGPEAVLETLRKQGRPPRKTWTFDSVPGEMGCQSMSELHLLGVLFETYVITYNNLRNSI